MLPSTSAGAEPDVLRSCKSSQDPSHPATTHPRRPARHRDPAKALRRLRCQFRELIATDEEGRQAAATQIHEQVAQPLIAALMHLEAIRGKFPQSSASPHACVAGHEPLWHESLTLLRDSLVHAKRLINALRPPILDELGIAAAVEHLIHELQIDGGPQIEYDSTLNDQRFGPLLESMAYRIVEESLDNALRHSGSATIRVSLLRQNRQLCLRVEDRGHGFDPKTARRHGHGLLQLQARAGLLGGIARVDTAPGRGTRVTAELPLDTDRTSDGMGDEG